MIFMLRIIIALGASLNNITVESRLTTCSDIQVSGDEKTTKENSEDSENR